MKKNGILFTLVMMLTIACSETETMIEDHIFGSWELKVYLRNDADETLQISIRDYAENYALDGTFTRSYLDGKQSQVQDTGSFEIDEDKRSIHISGVSSIADFSELHSTLSASFVDILILDDSEYVYAFENGGDTHEFRFIRND